MGYLHFYRQHRRFGFLLRFLLFFSISSALITSCATPEKDNAAKKAASSKIAAKKPGAPKPGEKEPGGLNADGTNEAISPPAPVLAAPKPTVAIEDMAAFIGRASDPSGPFTDTDRQLIATIPPNPPAGSVQEAAVALGILRTVNNPFSTPAATFVESDIKTDGQAAAGTPPGVAGVVNNVPTLESAAAEKKMDLPEVLERSTFLHTEGVARQTLSALVRGKNSDEFARRMRATISKQALAWKDLGDHNGLFAPTVAPVPAIPTPLIAPPPAAAGTPVAQAPVSPSAAAATPDLSNRSGDALMSEAQALADKGDLDGAIVRVEKVATDSPQYAGAQEKLKQYSNLAVHALRTKAAQAYSTASPMNDMKSRSIYLEKARNYLEEALNKYPHADQLARVRENLAVITQDLAKLGSSGQGKDGPANR